MQRLSIPVSLAIREAARRLLLAACCFAGPFAAHAQQVLLPATPVSTGILIGTNAGIGSPTGCSSAGVPSGFPVGMGMREHPSGNYVGAMTAYDVQCASLTVTEGAGAATLAFGGIASSGFIGRPTDASHTTSGPFNCPAGQMVSRVGGAYRYFNGASAGYYPTYIYYACRPIAVITGDWFNLNLSLGGAVVVLGSATDAATPPPGPLSGNIEACAESPTRTCNGIYDTGGGALIDGFFGSSSNFPNARVSQTISFVNYAWNQATGDSTQTTTWRPSAAGNLFHPSLANNNTLRYQQTYERYVYSGAAYSGGLTPPAGTSTLAYSRTGTCATAHTLGLYEDYTCTNIITGRPDLQVRVTNPASAWTAYGQYQNVTLTAKNFGSAATDGTNNATAVLTLPTGWDAGTLPANCAKAGSPVVVTCQINPTPLAASSGPGLTDGGQVDFVIPVTPLAGVAVGSYPVLNGAKVCVQPATGGNAHVCTVPNDADPFNDDGVNALETATLVVAYQAPPALPPSVQTTVVSNGGVGTFAFTSSNGAAPLPASLVTTTPGVGVTAAPSMLTTVGTSTILQQGAPPAGFVLTDISCTGMSAGGTATYALATRRVTFNAAATGYGATIACTFTNTRLAVTVRKVSNGGVGTFNFTGTNGVVGHAVTTATPGVAVSGDQQSLTTIGAATTVTEAAPPAGWRLTGIACTGLGTGGTATPTIPGTGTGGGSVSLDAAATATGSNIVCTFTNAKLPTVTVSKVSIGGTGTFAFSGTNGIAAHNVSTVASGTPATGVTQILSAAATATNVVESAPPAGFVLTGVACTGLGAGGSATPNLATRTVTLDAAATAVGSDIACTFTNTAVSSLKLVKTSSTPNFIVGVPASYTLTLTNTGVFATQAATTVTDSVPATLTLGAMPAGCSATGQVVSCTVPAGLAATTGSTSFVIPVTPLATAVPSVSNTATANGGGDPLCVGTGNCTSTVVTPVLAQPRVTVRKTTTNGSGSNTFGFALSGVTNPADSVTLTGATSVSSAVVHTGTVGSDATLAESSVPAGWPANPAAVSCLDSATATSGNITTNLATLAGNVATLPGSVMRAGAVITCTFTNTATPILALAKSAPGTVAPGAALAYGLSLVNSGAIATGTSVVVREQLPPGVVATSVGLGAGVTAVACGTLPSAPGALLSCTMSITGGIPVGGTRSFTLNTTAPSTAALASAGTVLTNHANTHVAGSGTPATAPGAACVSDAVVSCANASTTIVAGAGALLQSGVRTVTDNQLANGTAQDVLEAIVRDAAQNPVAGAVVTFAAAANVAFNGGAVGAAGTCTTGASGRCQVTATSSLVGLKSSAVSIAAGTVTGAFTAGGDAFHATPVTYTFVLGAPSAAQSGLRIVTDNALANGVAQDVLQVFIRDAGGNPAGAGVVVSFGATPNVAFNGGAVGAAGSCTTTAASTCQVTATSTIAAVYGSTPVTLGGSALAGTFTASGNSYLPSPQPYKFGALPTLTIRKISLNAIGTFDFSGSNGVVAQSITTGVAGTPASGPTQTLTAPNIAMTITEAVPPAGFTLTSASCTGMGAGGTATLSGRVLSLNAAATAPGSALVCTFTNTGSTIVPPPIPPTIMCTTNAAVFNTGYGPSGPLTSGRDTVWESGEGTPTGGPGSVPSWQRSYVGNQAPGAWINSPFGNANWISNYPASGHTVDVDVYHRFTFNLAPSVTPSSFSLKLDFYSDNSVAEVFVNGVLQTVPGVPQGGGNPYYHVGFVAGAGASATLASNWQAGTNTVVVHVKSGPGAEGFLAQTTTTAVCAPPTVTLSKTTLGGAGGTFNFALTNTTQATGTATTVVAGTPVQVDGNTATAGLQSFTASAVGTAVTLTEAVTPGWNLASASCTDAGVVVGGLGSGAAARTYTIPAASMQFGKALQCLFTNTASATVTTRKVSLGAVGSFGFTGDNGLSAQSLTTVTAGTAVAGAVQTLTVPGVATTLTEDPLPANYALTAVGCTGLGAGGTATPDLPNRKVVLDAAATAAGSNIVCTFTNTYTPPYPKVQIVKTTVGGTGSNVFGFALSGLSAPTDTITVVGAGTASGSTTLVGTAGLAASIKESVPAGWPANPVSASCVDAASATPTIAFGTLVGNQLTIPAANMVAGAAITCTFTNSFGFSVGGRVFNDNGVGAGTANDGLINGSEAGIAGVTVRLTNCAATVFASAVTDGAGRYTLAVPFATVAGAPLCVEETNPATPSAWTSTGASAGGTALPSGTTTTVAGTAYTYTRTGTPDRIAFAWNGAGPASLDFGDVAPNTLAADGAKTGLPGSTVSYPHTFKAQTGGVVRFGIPGEVATPALAGWSGKIFADVGCTGALQAGAALLYPPSAPVTVVAGQSVCLVMQEFVPATAMNGHSNNATVEASFDFSNAGPALGASYTVHDITTVSDSVLELKKEVRNVTQGGAFGINNQAKSGETLEYRITYTNNGVSPIGTLSVNDTTPSYTSFVGAQAGSTPATLTACQKTTPANPLPAPTVACATAQAVGGTGALGWHFTGVLSPAGSGTVLFTVRVD
ncbi:prealbumin-like fold domain-containing protein [Variovorax sp. LT1P1]|uniref:prealbumin-like fold domain-containing protein n=1 Tax=Variovorax sp. LT1P1 TaxID=3443730 RepID=UPI003F46DC03